MSPAINKAIDPKRPSLSKSTVTSAAYCARRAWYADKRRLPDGARKSFAMPERVIFGVAVDQMTAEIVAARRDGVRITDKDLVLSAANEGLREASQRWCSEEIDWSKFGAELFSATESWLAAIDSGVMPVDENTTLQGVEGESLRFGEGPDAALGTPDFIVRWPDGRPGIVDVKAAFRRKGPVDMVNAEVSYYAWLYSSITGEIPRFTYASWVRTKNPEWQVLTEDLTPAHVALGAEYVSTTRALLAASRAEDVTFDSASCRSCEWAKPVPDVKHAGCSVGMAVIASYERGNA